MLETVRDDIRSFRFSADGYPVPPFPLLFTKSERAVMGLLLTVQLEQQWQHCQLKLCDEFGNCYLLPGPYQQTKHVLVDYPRNVPYDYFDTNDAAHLINIILDPRSDIVPVDITPFLHIIEAQTPDVSTVIDSNRHR
jgi:hypothetical protein